MNCHSFLKAIAGVAAGLLFAAGAAHAGEHGTAAEAEALVKKAVAAIKANGAEKTYEEITTGHAFKDRDLYVFVSDLSGKNLAHGANPKMVGKDLIDVKDPDGKFIIRSYIEVGKDKGKGWAPDNKTINPVTKTIEVKSTYVERVGDTIVGCGYYKL